MARLSGPPDRFLEFEPVSYQYDLEELLKDYRMEGTPSPEVVSAARGALESDANWVDIRITAHDRTRHWTATTACFDTVGLPQLVAWCRTLAAGEEPHRRVFKVMEPCIQFEALGTGAALRLRVLFQLEFRPPGLPFASPKHSPAAADADDVVIEFTPGCSGLADFADTLEAEAGRFPVREWPFSR